LKDERENDLRGAERFVRMMMMMMMMSVKMEEEEEE
jgi:hypothetical protein